MIATVAVVALGVGGWFARETWQDRKRCQTFAELQAKFGTAPIGSGPTPVRVVGDSYTEGMGLDVPRESWVASFAKAADATVTADGASSTGFTNPGSCGRGDFVSRTDASGGLLIAQGGLNDVGVPEEDVRNAACAVIEAVGGDVVIVGPPLAPVRDAEEVRLVDAALSRAAAECGARYISTLGWDLDYVDELHLTAESHNRFGQMVAQHIA